MKEPTDHLQNNGIVKLGPQNNASEKTIIILGVGRGGTSLCSKAIHNLNIPTGSDSRPPTYEDLPLSKALEEHDFEKAKELINSYNRNFGTWAFKRPTTNDTLSQLNEISRNPIYIVIFRDILAIAHRNFLSMGTDAFSTMQKAIDDYQKIINFLKRENCTALLASYEKVLNNRELFIDSIISFIYNDKQVPTNARSNAIESISPSPEDYLINTSAVDFYGYLDLVSEEEISGWAAYQRSETPITLELFINNQLRFEFIPDKFREDIKSKGLHPTGRCGFTLKPEFSLIPGDLVSVRYKSNGVDLRKSPKTVSND